jgi:nitrogen regulatory protein P-II 1
MKKVEAIIRHYKLEEVRDALTEAGVGGMTISEVRGFGRQRGHKEVYRGAEYTVDFVPKVKVEFVVNDDLVESSSKALIEAARSGNVGDGKLFVTEIAEAVRIRTGETGSEAL